MARAHEARVRRDHLRIYRPREAGASASAGALIIRTKTLLSELLLRLQPFKPISWYGLAPGRQMRPFRAIYPGYAIYVSDSNSAWSTTTEPLTSDLPILSRPYSNG